MQERWEEWSAAELGKAVNERKVTPSALINYFADRIEKRNKSINAFVYTKVDEALSVAYAQEKALAAGKTLAPFAGVPFGLKDFLPDKPGWQSSHGGVKCLVATDTAYSAFCEGMERAGGIALGKTNAPAYGFRGTTDNKMYGATSTPFDLAYNAGGSSGGSAAAVADGLVPIAEGGDAGGSIRIPASFNNLFGFKAGLGVIPSYVRPDGFSATHPHCCNGGLTKTVEDTAILLDYCSYYDRRDPFSLPKQGSFVEQMHQPIQNLRIGYTVNFDLFEVEESVKAQFLQAVEEFKRLGVPVEEVHFNFTHSANALAEQWCRGITVDCAVELGLLKEKGVDLLKEHRNDFPEEFIHYKEICDKMGIFDLYQFNLARSDVLDNLESAFERYDFILSPVASVSGILNAPSNTKGPAAINGKPVESLIGWTQTFLANFVGYPSASIPCSFIGNIPFGVQVTAKKYTDGKLLALARQFELVHPWRQNYAKALSRKL